MARLKGQGEGKNRMREMDTVRGSRSSTKESREEDGRVKGTYWRGGGGMEEWERYEQKR